MRTIGYRSGVDAGCWGSGEERSAIEAQRHDEDALTRAIIQPSQPVRALWLSPDHGITARSRLGVGQGPGATDLAPGGVKSATEAAATTRPVVAEHGSCIELRPDHENLLWSSPLRSGD